MRAESVRKRVVVHGVVQGVFFRDTTRRLAEARGIAGSVRNRPDGAVEALFEGSPDAVEELLDFCRVGPSDALVERIEVGDEEPQGLCSFRIG